MASSDRIAARHSLHIARIRTLRLRPIFLVCRKRPRRSRRYQRVFFRCVSRPTSGTPLREAYSQDGWRSACPRRRSPPYSPHTVQTLVGAVVSIGRCTRPSRVPTASPGCYVLTKLLLVARERGRSVFSGGTAWWRRHVEFDPLTDFWLLAWDMFGAREYPFDEARKLATGCWRGRHRRCGSSKRSCCKPKAASVTHAVLPRDRYRREPGFGDLAGVNRDRVVFPVAS